MNLDNKIHHEEIEKMIMLLDEQIKKASVVFIAPHSGPRQLMDFDALASAAAICELCKRYNKRAFIVSDDQDIKLSSDMREMKSNLSKKYPFITSDIMKMIREDNLTDDEIDNIINNNKSIVLSCLRMIHKERGLKFFLNYISQSEMNDLINESDEKLISKLVNNKTIAREAIKEIFRGYNNNEELLICVDHNKTYLSTVNNVGEPFSNIIVIDHHQPDSATYKTDKILTLPEMTSTSEIVFHILKENDIVLDSYLAECLLAGIYLDTNHLLNVKDETDVFSTVAELCRLGADYSKVVSLFRVKNYELEQLKRAKIAKLTDNAIMKRYDVAIAMNEEEVYEDDTILAQAADEILQYENVSASFVLGYVDRAKFGIGHTDKISIKARSNNRINVEYIMKLFNGGGDPNRAAGIIENSNIEYVKAALDAVLSEGFVFVPSEKMSDKVRKFIPSK